MNFIKEIYSFSDTLATLVKQNPITSLGGFFASIPPIAEAALDFLLGAFIDIGSVDYKEPSIETVATVDIITWSKFGIWIIFMFFVISRVVYKMLKDRQELIRAERENKIK